MYSITNIVRQVLIFPLLAEPEQSIIISAVVDTWLKFYGIQWTIMFAYAHLSEELDARDDSINKIHI